MADHWSGKLETYLDGELPAAEMRELDAHLRSCPPCAADLLGKLQAKRAVRAVGKRYSPSPEFRQRIRASIAAKPQPSPMRMWLGVSFAFALLIVAGFVTMSVRQQQRQRQQTLSELADLHVVTLASANPVDVVSTDRHTVKPWFQGKIPFTFNLPELQNSPFTLVGGRVTYLAQAPGAELIYQVRQHKISVFIFQDRTVGQALGSSSRSQTESSFNVETWAKDGLRYFLIGDASGDDIRNLAEILQKAL